jgi:hypothetical protein
MIKKKETQIRATIAQIWQDKQNIIPTYTDVKNAGEKLNEDDNKLLGGKWLYL